MDPVTALGVVSGAIAIIDGTTKVLGIAWDIYHSVEGSSEETEFRLKLSESMSAVSQRLISTDKLATSNGGQDMVALAEKCNQLSNDITRELAKLRPKRHKSMTQSILAARRTVSSKRKIEGLEKQRSECQKQLHFQIAYVSSQDLKKLFAEFNENTAKLTELDRTIGGLKETLQSVDRTQVQSMNDQALGQIRNILNIGHEALCEVVQDRILRGVKGGFDDLDYRYQSVERPFGDTFEWIFDLDRPSIAATKFTKWLSSGDGIFHICGKLGSGKSTLMKKLYDHDRTKTELEHWARTKGDRTLIMANFFFYALGTDYRQRSFIGLYRTLIYHILRKQPILTKDILPVQWTKALSQSMVRSTFVIQDNEIEDTFKRLMRPLEEDILTQYCFCFFIDGLDEYQVTISADRGDLVHRLLTLTNNRPDTFKLCVSSREENPFMNAFSEINRLYLHELTYSDIGKYVDGRLQSVANPEDRHELVRTVTKKAQGVFLWVVLVVQQIRKRSDDGDLFPDLFKEIESLPEEMNELLRRVLDKIHSRDSIRFSYVVHILQFLNDLHNKSESVLQFDLEDFSFLEEYERDNRFAQSTQFPFRDLGTAPERQALTKTRLRAVCRGLVGVSSRQYSKPLNFIHRSISDFLKQDQSWKVKIEDPHDLVEMLSQLKLANLRQYWWGVSQSPIPETIPKWEKENRCLQDQALILGGLIEQRHQMHLDVPPFDFLRTLDMTPGLSLSTSIDRAFVDGTARFHVSYSVRPGYVYHSSMLESTPCIRNDRFAFGSELNDQKLVETLRGEVSPHSLRSRPIMSPLFTELYSGREEYAIWRLENTEVPVEADDLVVLAYCAITGILGRRNVSGTKAEKIPWQGILRRLFEGKLVSPSFPTPLSPCDEFSILHIAAPEKRLSIWQHFVCWWVTVVATHNAFHVLSKEPDSSDESMSDSGESLKDPCHENEGVRKVLELFMTSGAELGLLLKIQVSEQKLNHIGKWVNFDLELVLSGGEILQLVTALDLKRARWIYNYSTRFPREWYEAPPADKVTWSEALALPDSHMSLRDWINLSEQPNKQGLLELMDKQMEVKEQQDTGFGRELLQDDSGRYPPNRDPSSQWVAACAYDRPHTRNSSYPSKAAQPIDLSLAPYVSALILDRLETYFDAQLYILTSLRHAHPGRPFVPTFEDEELVRVPSGASIVEPESVLGESG